MKQLRCDKKLDKKIRLVLIIFMTVLLVGCSKEVNVSDGEYGVLIRYGEVVSHLKGPGSIKRVPIIETVILVDEENVIILGNGKYEIRYKVIDPEKFLVMTGTQIGGFEELLEKEIANQAMQGKDMSTKGAVLKVIERMELPIVVLAP